MNKNKKIMNFKSTISQYLETKRFCDLIFKKIEIKSNIKNVWSGLL